MLTMTNRNRPHRIFHVLVVLALDFPQISGFVPSPFAPCATRADVCCTVPTLMSASTEQDNPMAAYEKALQSTTSRDSTKMEMNADSVDQEASNTNGTTTKTNTSTTTQNTTASATADTKKDQEEETAPDLYEILGASPKDSKKELKRKYVALAKQTHPDALLNGQESADGQLEFSEIAAAYQVLSDKKQRKRYDRKIKAEALGKELADFAGDVAEKAAPQVRDILDTVAMPFLRRTTATTLASFQAAAKEIRQDDTKNGTSTGAIASKEPDLGGVFVSAMKAAQKAGRIVDNIELMEKSEVLESQVLDQIDEANKIKSELDDTTLRRVLVALMTPNASFSASDASLLLGYWNISSTFLERAKLKNPVDRKIQDLEVAEESLSEKELELEGAWQHYRESESDLQKARADRVLALQAEKRAREALVLAQRDVAESKSRLINTTKSLSQAETVMEKIAQEREKMASLLSKQQEDVRKSVLGRKEVSDACKEEEEPIELEELEKKEADLIQEYSRLEVEASQLQSKANKLRDRAEQLKEVQ